MVVDYLEDRLGQLVFLQQTAELQQGGGIRCRFAAEVNADEGADRLAVVERIFRPLVRQAKALLGHIHA